MLRLIMMLVLAVIILPAISLALNIEEKLESPVQEQQAQEVFKQLRCVVCSGESIVDSRAELAKDLRALVRDKIKENYSAEEVLQYVATRYGDNVLMQPPLKSTTYLLWFGPLLILAVGFVIMFSVLRVGKKNGN